MSENVQEQVQLEDPHAHSLRGQTIRVRPRCLLGYRGTMHAFSSIHDGTSGGDSNPRSYDNVAVVVPTCYRRCRKIFLFVSDALGK
jgi:hypothetical protein